MRGSESCSSTTGAAGGGVTAWRAFFVLQQLVILEKWICPWNIPSGPTFLFVRVVLLGWLFLLRLSNRLPRPRTHINTQARLEARCSFYRPFPSGGSSRRTGGHRSFGGTSLDDGGVRYRRSIDTVFHTLAPISRVFRIEVTAAGNVFSGLTMLKETAGEPFFVGCIPRGNNVVGDLRI